MQIKVTLDDAGAARVLIEGEHDAQNLEQAMIAIAGEVDDRIQGAFADEKDPVTGAVWPELRPVYLRWRKRKRYGTDKLDLTGAMKRAIVTERSDRGITVHAPIEYSAVHQKGNGRVPRRRFAGISPQDADEFAQILREHLGGRK